MKFKIEDSVPLPKDWDVSGVRGNGGFTNMLREMKEGQSFALEVFDEKSNKELNNIRNAITGLRNSKFGRRNYIVRLVDKDDVTGRKTYRVWAVPFASNQSQAA